MSRDDAIPSRAARKLAELLVPLVRDLAAAVSSGRPADVTLNEIFNAHREWGSRDRRFLSAAVFSFFRWRGWTDHIQLDLPAACLVAFLLDAAAPHPAVQELATQALPEIPWEPLGPRSLPEKAAALQAWFGLSEPPPLTALVPAWVGQELAVPEMADPATHLANCILAFQERPPVWLRAPRDQETRLAEALLERGYAPRQHPRLRCALALPSGTPLEPLRQAVGIAFEVQDLASQAVGIVCDPAPGQAWWDVCAGAGGKALHLADLMGYRGRILATDVRPAALRELERRARFVHARLIETQLYDATAQPAPEGLFDGVLVDAPCTGVGTWSRNPDARWRTSVGDVNRQADRQRVLLRAVAQAVRPGGALVYSVCTLTREETTSVLVSFLRDHPHFALEEIPHPLTGHPTSGSVWIWPWEASCDGMFIARLCRKR